MVESWDFPGSGLALGKGEFAGLGVPGRLESFWIADVTVVLALLRRSSTLAVSSSGSESSSLSKLRADLVPSVGVSLK